MKRFLIGTAASVLIFASLAIPAFAAGDTPIMLYCTKDGENPIYVAPSNIRSYAGKDGWDCRPAPAP